MDDETVRPVEWANWPWHQCRARAVDENGQTVRCELRRRRGCPGGHLPDHRAERGMYDLTWPIDVATAAPS